MQNVCTQIHLYFLVYVHTYRDISNVCGFTREVLTALIANIETREWRRREIAQSPVGIPEHPRASNTDDVKCFFSVLCDHVGTNFTLKQVKFAWRKVCIEFRKRTDPSLPFYYFTSSHDRFYEGPHPSFNKPVKNKRSKRVSKGEQVASLTSGRATLPVRGSLSVRPQFHKQAVSVPPPSSVPTYIAEHAYVQRK